MLTVISFAAAILTAALIVCLVWAIAWGAFFLYAGAVILSQEFLQDWRIFSGFFQRS